MTSATFKAFPSTPFNTLVVTAVTAPNTEPYWSAMAYILSQFPSLGDQGISAYTSFAPNTTSNGAQIGVGVVSFFLPSLSPSNSSASLPAAIAPVVSHINATYPNQFVFSLNATTWPSFYAWWSINSGPNNAGYDLLFGSRLLDKRALTANVTALKEAIKGATAPGLGSGALLVPGRESAMWCLAAGVTPSCPHGENLWHITVSHSFHYPSLL
jgi:hypothetical protein